MRPTTASHQVVIERTLVNNHTQPGLMRQAFDSRVARLKAAGIKHEIHEDGNTLSVAWTEPRADYDDRGAETVRLTYIDDMQDDS